MIDFSRYGRDERRRLQRMQRRGTLPETVAAVDALVDAWRSEGRMGRPPLVMQPAKRAPSVSPGGGTY